MFLPSETARLVLSYMLDQSPMLPTTVASFLAECPHLAELVSVMDKCGGVGQLSHFCRVGGKSLYEVLTEYTTMLTMIHDKAREKGMVDSFMEPISRVMEVVLNPRPSPVSESTVSQSNLPLMQTTSTQTEAMAGSTADAEVQTLAPSSHPTPGFNSTPKATSTPGESVTLRDSSGTSLTLTPLAPTPSHPARYSCFASVNNQVVWSDSRGKYNKIASKDKSESDNNVEVKFCPPDPVENKPTFPIKPVPKFRSGPTRNSLKSFPPYPPPTRKLPFAQAQSYRLQNSKVSQPKLSYSSEFEFCPPPPIHRGGKVRVEVLDFHQMEVEEDELISEKPSINGIAIYPSKLVSEKVSTVNQEPNNYLIKFPGHLSSTVRSVSQEQIKIPCQNTSKTDSPKLTLKVKDNLSLFGAQALDLSNNNNSNSTMNNNIKMVKTCNTMDKVNNTMNINSTMVKANSMMGLVKSNNPMSSDYSNSKPKSTFAKPIPAISSIKNDFTMDKAISKLDKADNMNTTMDSKSTMNNTNNKICKSNSTIIPINSDTMFLLSGNSLMTGSIKVEAEDPSYDLTTTPEEVLCCPDTASHSPVPEMLGSGLPATGTPRKRGRPKKVTATLPDKVTIQTRKDKRRKSRCQKCPGCLRKDCGVCKNCQDRPKFGGPNKMKQACAKKRCSNWKNAGNSLDVAEEEIPDLPADQVGGRLGEEPVQGPSLPSPAEVAGVSRLDEQKSKSPISLSGKVLQSRKRRRKCRTCVGCKSSDCGKCKSCKNKVKFGGDGHYKQACRLKVCKNPHHPDSDVENAPNLKDVRAGKVKTERRKKVRAIKPSQRSKRVKVQFNLAVDKIDDIKPTELSDYSDESDDFDDDSQDTSFEDVSTRGRKRHCKARFLDFFFEDKKS